MTEHDHREPPCPDCRVWDPLASTRTPEDPPLDVLTTGPLFFDLIFSGLPRLPEPGEELFSTGMGSCPGGIANLATATARLGLHTGLVTGFGDDAYADWMWDVLQDDEHIDLSASRRFTNFHSALTVSMAFRGDRGMVTHVHELPESLESALLEAPAAKAAAIDLNSEGPHWRTLKSRGTLLFADIGFDDSGKWDPARLAPLEFCHAFTPNAVEAMAYTHTDRPTAAVRKLAELVPLAIVTDGVGGSFAIDGSTGEEAYCPSVPVEAIDPTGAGDVFAASIVLGTLAGWPLEFRLRFASLSASMAVRRFGGSLAAPGWGDIADWWRTLSKQADDGDLRAAYIARDYAFLAELIPTHPVAGVRRAEGTFALAAHLGYKRGHPEGA
ncbi:Sugar or nucleoside kinase, ribokinase family [Tessaracoccus bendigoensis DSM 12906]|uniref:Sugar or nucleoside kinase, ribokinase family n=1 Tax=Tessaracoccus bendigoensis DSM 12906 TaxID=1123357 RepID=A0A1M6I984_9ACTN|nr:PfkB family carbohydrate kinase [Tessaracoccus bendigoensis]SHJ30908.1 Sugar or nucleoside kinase, ribokinase family [Tessaracoccus bendigoensis DSM 12906]